MMMRFHAVSNIERLVGTIITAILLEAFRVSINKS